MRLLFLACFLYPNIAHFYADRDSETRPMHPYCSCEAEHDPEDAWAGEEVGLEETDEELERPAKR